MTSPGGVEVGRVSVRVVPDTSKFLSDAKKELKALAKDLRVQVALELNTSGVQAEIEKAKKQADDTKLKLGVEVDGDGVTRETRRIRQLAQKLVGSIKLIVGINLPASLARVKTEMKVIQKIVQGYNLKVPIEFVGLSKWLGILGLISGVLLTIPHLIGAIGGAVNVVGGALALIPALAGAAAFGIAALIVGMNGFFSALSKAGDAAAFEEALKDLTPAAQESARALAEFREPLSEIRKAVQEQLFKGMAEPFRSLKALLPPIKQGLEGAAGGIRDMAKAWIEMATSQKSVEDASTIASNSTKMFEAMRPAAASFGQALRDIAVVGSTFLPKLGEAVSSVTGKFAAWAEKARETGRLEEIIQNFIDKMKQLGRIAADIKVAFENIFRAMSGGREFLDIVEGITQGFREWSEAKGTQETLARLANIMRVVAEAAKELFGQAFESAGKILKDLEPFLMTFARGLSAFVAGAIRFVTPLLQSLARWLSENRAVMVPLILMIATLVTGFKLLVTAANAVIALKKSFLALRAASSIIGTVSSTVGTAMKNIILAMGRGVASAWAATGRFVAAWAHIAAEAIRNSAIAARAWITSAAKSAAFTAKYYAIMVATAIRNWVRMTAVAVANAVKIAAVWIAQLARMVAATVAQMAVAVAVWVANWVRMAAVALANAARMALAWLIAMGPVGIVIGIILALVAIIILNWDKIVAAFDAAWTWCWNLIQTIWGWIWDKISTVLGWITAAWDAAWKFVSDTITWARDLVVGAVERMTSFMRGIGDIVGEVIGFFERIGAGIAEKWNQAVDFVKSIPGRIVDALGDLGRLLWEQGKKIIQGFLDGLKAAWEKVTNFISGIGSWIADHKGPLSYDAKLLIPHGKAIMSGLSDGLSTGFSNVQTQVQSMGQRMADALDTSLFGATLASSITDSVPGAIEAVDRLMAATNDRASAEWQGRMTAEGFTGIGDQILDALSSGALVVELDGKNVTKSVNKNNVMNRRR